MMHAGDAASPTTSPMLALSDDVFRVIVGIGAHDHGVSRLRILRAVCTTFRILCSAISEDVYRNLHDRADQMCGCFPSWSSGMKLTGVTCLEMGEWVQLYLQQVAVTMREIRFNSVHETQPGAVKPTDSVCAAFDKSEPSEVLDVLDDPTRARDLWYKLISTPGDQVRIGLFRLRVLALNHVTLPSVVTWFEGFGWRLDTCAALLFSCRCAQLMDAGSTWMATGGGWICHMLDAHDRLVSVSSFVRRLIEERKEEMVLQAVRRRFDATWTMETHSALYELLKGSLLHSGGTVVQTAHRGGATPARGNYGGLVRLGSYEGMVASVKQDFTDLHKKLVSETKSAAQLTATVEVIERKMKACIPQHRIDPTADGRSRFARVRAVP